MSETPKPDPLARAVHVSLLTGSAVSALLFVVGLTIALTSGKPRPDAAPQLDTALFRAALQFDAVPLLDLGLLALMLTPLVRIVILAGGWALQRDFRFAIVAVTVLLFLIASLFIGVDQKSQGRVNQRISMPLFPEETRSLTEHKRHYRTLGSGVFGTESIPFYGLTAIPFLRRRRLEEHAHAAELFVAVADELIDRLADQFAQGADEIDLQS
jgi:uncharacterized membrane protein